VERIGVVVKCFILSSYETEDGVEGWGVLLDMYVGGMRVIFFGEVSKKKLSPGCSKGCKSWTVKKKVEITET